MNQSWLFLTWKFSVKKLRTKLTVDCEVMWLSPVWSLTCSTSSRTEWRSWSDEGSLIDGRRPEKMKTFGWVLKSILVIFKFFSQIEKKFLKQSSPEDVLRCLFRSGLDWLGGSAKLIRSGLSEDLGLFETLPPSPAGGKGAALFLLDFGGVDDRGLVDREELVSWT